MNKSVIKQLGMFFGTLILAVAVASMTAQAQSGTGGGGGGSAVTVGCGSPSNTTAQNIAACGNETLSTSSGIFSVGGVTLNVLTSSTLAEQATFDDLTPGNETLFFGFAYGPGANTFSLNDFSSSSEADFSITGTVLSLVQTLNSTGTGGTWALTLQPTMAVLDPAGCEFCGTTVTLPSGITGTITITFDPNSVTGVSGGIGGGPFGNGGSGTTPEPSTLLLLGSGLTGIGFLRRKFAGV